MLEPRLIGAPGRIDAVKRAQVWIPPGRQFNNTSEHSRINLCVQPHVTQLHLTAEILQKSSILEAVWGRLWGEKEYT